MKLFIASIFRNIADKLDPPLSDDDFVMPYFLPKSTETIQVIYKFIGKGKPIQHRWRNRK